MYMLSIWGRLGGAPRFIEELQSEPFNHIAVAV